MSKLQTEYAKVINVTGQGRCRVKINMTGRETIGKMCGVIKRRKKDNWITKDNIVLVAIRDFEENMVDIVQVFNDQESRKLIKDGKYIEYFVKHQDEDNFTFDEI